MNTRKAYSSDLAYIQQGGFENFNFPMTEVAILLFITDLEEREKKSKFVCVI